MATSSSDGLLQGAEKLATDAVIVLPQAYPYPDPHVKLAGRSSLPQLDLKVMVPISRTPAGASENDTAPLGEVNDIFPSEYVTGRSPAAVVNCEVFAGSFTSAAGFPVTLPA